ncbi:MAG TPA: hypothetical protein VFQ75_05300, partial [Candidatus Limnocylindrales bacterium]|nr:hypothetical protein [Candidatus Limnocylindrales bacterium]
MAWIGLALRRLRADRPATVGLAVLVLVTALLAALSPRVLARFADDAVRTAVAEAPAAARNIALIQHLLIGPGPEDDPLQFVRAAGLERERTFPAPVRALITGRSAAVESGRFHVDKATTDPAFARLRIQEGVDDYIRYVQGVPPTATVTTRDDVGPTAQDGVPVYEVGISEATAKGFGLSLGETVPLTGDPGDPLIGRGSRDALAFATVTGIYEVTRPDADFWLDDPTLIHPVIRALSAEVQLLDAAFLLADATHDPLARAMAGSDRVLRYTWRSFLDPDLVSDANLDRTITAFRQLQVQYPSANVTAAADTALRTGMLPILEQHRARWYAAESVVSVIALGPALVAVGTLALIAVLAARRRRSTMVLARSRGASGAQVVLPVLVEGLLIGVPAAIVAAVGAVLLVPAGRIDTTIAAAAAVVVVGVVVVIATVAGVARGQGLDRGGPGARIVTDVGPRRLVLEGLIVAAAIGGAILLRQRGVAAVGAANGGTGFDPLVAAVPALVGLAAGIVVIRLYPVPLAAVAWVAARGRGLVPMLAARRAREGGASSAVLLVLLAT